jgi:hypothetical protein
MAKLSDDIQETADTLELVFMAMNAGAAFDRELVAGRVLREAERLREMASRLIETA